MNIGSTNSTSGMETALRSAQAMNDVLQNAVDKSQDLGKKFVGIVAEQKVGSGEHAGQVDFRA